MNLNEEDKITTQSLLTSFADVFDPVFHPDGILCEPMKIDLFNEDTRIFSKARPRIHASGLARFISDEEECKYQSPVVLIEYQSKKPRLAGDYSGVNGLNNSTINIPVELPLLSELNETLARANFIASLDLPRAFYQMKISEEDVTKTTLAIPGLKIALLRASFGLKNVLAVLNIFVYFDDVIIAAETFPEFQKAITFVLEQARKFRVRFASAKSIFTSKEHPIKLIGTVYVNGSRQIDPDRIKSILHLPAPPNPTALRSFIGAVNFVREFLPNVASLLTLLNDLLRKESQFKWITMHQTCFDNIKTLIADAIPLVLPDPIHPVIVTADASLNAIGGTIFMELPPYKPLAHLKERNLRPLSFFSKVLTNSQKNWSTIQKELFAILKVLTHSSTENFLLSRRFTLLTDHKNLTFLHTAPLAIRLVHRWLPILSQYSFDIEHVIGSNNLWADLLSRLVVERPIVLINRVKNRTNNNNKQLTVKETFLNNLSEAKKLAIDRKEYLFENTQFDNDFIKYRGKKLVPIALRKTVLLEAHGGPLAGHPGRDATTNLIHSADLNWPYLRKEVEDHIKSRVGCQKTATINELSSKLNRSLMVNKSF
ncbi:hypothetical protein RCL1_006658 [Eukaryota sp. TZLM3-RCL]